MWLRWIESGFNCSRWSLPLCGANGGWFLALTRMSLHPRLYTTQWSRGRRQCLHLSEGRETMMFHSLCFRAMVARRMSSSGDSHENATSWWQGGGSWCWRELDKSRWWFFGSSQRYDNQGIGDGGRGSSAGEWIRVQIGFHQMWIWILGPSLLMLNRANMSKVQLPTYPHLLRLCGERKTPVRILIGGKRLLPSRFFIHGDARTTWCGY